MSLQFRPGSPMYGGYTTNWAPPQQGRPPRQLFGMPAAGGERGAGQGGERGRAGGGERGGSGDGDRVPLTEPELQAGRSRWGMGSAQPIPPQSQGTPYGGPPSQSQMKSSPGPQAGGGLRAWGDPSNPSGPGYQPGGMFNHAPILPVPQQQPSPAGGQSPWGGFPLPQNNNPVPSFGGGFGGGMPGGGFGGSWAPPPSRPNVPPGWQPASPGGGQRAWQQQHQQAVASPANQRWLGSMTPANRQVYSLLQGLY
jgi:hypothetical protein